VALRFPISRDPPEGGTAEDHFGMGLEELLELFPISRDPPEGGTSQRCPSTLHGSLGSFQFLGIPPKGEHEIHERANFAFGTVSNF